MIDLALKRDDKISIHRHAIINTDMVVQAEFRSCRDIFIYCGLVIKTDQGRQTRRELDTWLQVAEEDRKFFHPIVAHGELRNGRVWIAQEFAVIQTIEEAHPDASSEQLRQLETEYEKVLSEAIMTYAIDDIGDCGRWGNWGLIGGEPKIYDWGISG